MNHSQLVPESGLPGATANPDPTPDVRLGGELDPAHRVMHALGKWVPALQSLRSADWLIEYSNCVTRHVETLVIQSPRWARRRLTIDIVVPGGTPGRSRLVPVTRLAKDYFTSFIDLVDEAGTTISLPTREELAVITRAALRPYITRFGAGPTERKLLDNALTMLVFGDPQYSQIGLSILQKSIDRNDRQVPPRLSETLRHLVDNSIIWLPLVGEPGRRRVFQFSYNIPLLPDVVPARHNVPRRMRLQWSTLTADVAAGRIAWRVTLRRARARAAARMGWDAFDVYVDDPVVEDPTTYHLQITASPGMDVTEIAADDEQIPPVRNGDRHLYINTPRPRQVDVIRLKLRAHRRGFLNASVSSTFILAALLWMFALNPETVTKDANLAPGAAVLLIAPALMALFVSRPTESALLAATLTGVRTALGASASVSLVAAAALAGARLTTTAQPTLSVCASVATLTWLSVLIAWLGTFHFVRRHGNRARQWWCGDPHARRPWALTSGVVASVALAAGGVVACLNVFGVSQHAFVLLGFLAIAPIAACAVWVPPRRGQASRGLVVVVALAALSACGLAVVILAHGLGQSMPWGARLVWLGAGVACAATALTVSASTELAPMETSSSWARERLG